MHGSNKLTAGKSQKKRKRGTQKLMLLKLLQINFFFFTLKRSETTYCMLHCVIAIWWSYKKWATVNLLKSFSEAPTFICTINPHEIAHRCQSEER